VCGVGKVTDFITILSPPKTLTSLELGENKALKNSILKRAHREILREEKKGGKEGGRNLAARNGKEESLSYHMTKKE